MRSGNEMYKQYHSMEPHGRGFGMNLIVLVVSFQVLVGNINGQSSSISDTHVALFVFGDSLYDVGMNAYFKKGTFASNAPYGETYFKTPTGRYSDGRLIPDYITQYAKLPFLQAYLKPGFSNYTNGVNFASAGACVLSDIRPGTLINKLVCTYACTCIGHMQINLKMQVNYFGQMVQKLKTQIGAAQSSKLLKQAVYLFNIGGNDYANLISTTINTQSILTPAYKTHYINMVLANLTTHIQTIYMEGGRKFAFQNVGPIGCLPSTKQIYADVGQSMDSCAKLPQTLVKTHNSLFLGIASSLQSKLSGFIYTVFDSYAQTNYRVQFNSKYGFKDSKTACCGTGKYNGAFTCGSPSVKFNLCTDPTDYLFFDAAHPTDKANGQFSQLFWSGPTTVVSPYTMQALFNMH
ncbi:hypothetical protein V2J09_005238 [Rumex salicifolius]